MTTALAGYLAIGQIAQHLDLTLPDDIAAGEPVTLGIRSVRPDGRSHHDPSFRWPWPGNWTPRIDADASAAECSHGLHIALGWRGLSATGPVHVCQIVGYRAADVAHVAATKLRVSQAAVLDVWDVHRMVRDGNLSYADLSGADLSYADLRSANLRGADLRSADLRYADLSYADLRSADLRSANLRYANLRSADLRDGNLVGANLRYADLRYADLRSADLYGANLRYADLRSAYHDKWTSWPPAPKCSGRTLAHRAIGPVVTIPQRPGPRRVDCGPALGKLHGGRILKDGAWSWPVGRFGVRTDAAFAEALDDYPTDHWWRLPWDEPPNERAEGLWPHQIMALDSLAAEETYVPARRVGWEMPLGSGKTRLSIEAAKLWRAANPDRGQLVVVLPLAVWSGWVRNLARWWPEATIGAAKGWHAAVTRGWSREQRAEMRSQVADLTPATAQSVDVVLSHWLCGDGAWAVVEAARPAVVVLDEVHRAKSTSARAHLRVNRTFAHGAIDSPGLLIGMSGTPMGQRPPELHGVQRLLDPTVFGWAASPHHARYFRRDEGASRAAGHDIPGAEFHSDEHAKRWRERRALSWLVVSPDSIERDWSVTAWETLDVDIGPDSRDAAAMKRDGVWTSPDGRVELIGDNALARRTHVHRLESGVADGQHDADHRTAKVKALGELLGERTEWPVIVWCTWRRTMDLVTVEAERLGLTVGEISGASKSGLSAAGRAAEGVDVVVCQVAAASEGIELVEAELAVWVDLPTSLTLWRQAVGRNDRAAESTHWREPVAVVLLGGEVDRTIWAALRDGYALQAEITAAMEAELLAAIDRASGLS